VLILAFARDYGLFSVSSSFHLGKMRRFALIIVLLANLLASFTRVLYYPEGSKIDSI